MSLFKTDPSIASASWPSQTLRRNVVIAVLAGFALVLIRFHISYGYPVGDSTQYNVPWAAAFGEQLRAGDFYPRWLFGYPENIGSPVFYFYGPIPFYLASVIGFLLPGDAVTRDLTILHFLMYWASGLAFYVWMRSLAPWRFALLGAAVYMALPYHFLDMELRNALGEGMGYIFLPLIFWSLMDIRSESRRWMLAMPAYAALVCSHIPSALLAVPAMTLAAVIVYRRNLFLGVSRLAFTGVAGALLAGPYLIPALGLRSLLPGDAWLNDPAYLPENWLLPHALFFRTGYLFYGAIFGVSAVAFCSLVWLWLAMRDGAAREKAGITAREWNILLTCLAVLVFSLAMMSEAAGWFWLHVGPLRNIQFPFRLGVITDFMSLTALTLSLSILARARNFVFRPIWLAYVFALTLVGFSVLVRLDDVAGVYATRQPALKADPLHCCVQAYEYWLPAVLGSNAYQRGAGEEAYQKAARQFAPVTAMRTLSPGEHIAMKRDRDGFEIVAKLDRDTDVRIAQAFFPLWQLKDKETGHELSLRPDSRTGLIIARLPARHTEFQLSLPASGVEKAGYLAAFAGLALLLFAWLKSRLKLSSRLRHPAQRQIDPPAIL